MRGHVRKRGNTWAVVYDEGSGEDGKRRQRWRGGFSTRREAQAFLTSILSTLGDGSYISPSKLTIREYLIEEWLPAIESTVRPLTFTQYESIVRLRLLPRLGHIRLQALTGGHLNALLPRAGADRLLDLHAAPDARGHPPRAQGRGPLVAARA
jgi:hypothetical protein